MAGAAVALALTSLLELVRADGWQHARVVAEGTLVIVAAERHGKSALLALHDGGATTPPPLVLDRALGPSAADDIEVTEAPLFGHAEVVDVTVTLGGRSAGSPLSSMTTSHYLVRVGLAADELACSFESDTRQYGVESSSGWDGRLRKVRDAPLTFDLVQTFSRAQMGGGSGWMDPGPKKTRYVVPERGVCSATVEVAPRLIGIGTLGQPKKRR